MKAFIIIPITVSGARVFPAAAAASCCFCFCCKCGAKEAIKWKWCHKQNSKLHSVRNLFIRMCVCVCVWVRVCIAKDLKMQFYFIFWLWSFKCKRRNNVATRSWNCICDHSSVLSRVECLPHVAHSGHCNSCRVLRPHSPLPPDNACLPGN